MRFHALYDKLYRADFLEAYRQVRRNGGAAGVDGETISDIEAYGVESGLGNWRTQRQDLYTASGAKVLIPKKQKGKFRPLGIPCLRDRVAQIG